MVAYGNQNIDRAMIGTALSSTQLGYYEYAANLPMQVTTQFSTVLNSVLFPAFASLQNDLGELRRVLLRVMRYNAFLLYPFLVGLALVADEFVHVAYGAAWAPVITPTRIFCLFGMIRVMTNPAYSVCNGIGKPQLPFKWSLIALPFNAALLWWGVNAGGLVGISMAKLFLPAFTLATLVVEITRKIGMPIRNIGLTALPAFCCCTGMAAVVLGLQRVPGMHGLHPIPHLLIEVIAGGAAYFAGMRLLFPADFADVIRLLRRFRPAA